MAGETPKCSVDECCVAARKRGMCSRHYLKWWRKTPKDLRPPTAQEATDQERFEMKVEKHGHGGCWLWTGARRASGHGYAVVSGVAIPAARAALEFAGSPRPGKLLALHRCDNPPCVNPKHLYWGTHQNNMDDAWARGAMPTGSERHGSKVTEAQVVEIRQRYADGAMGVDLAVEYGLSRPALYQITSGTKWRDVGGPITHRKPTGKVA